MASSLYICYFGVREPLVQTQVIPYLLELKKDGHDIALVTFEPDKKNKWSDDEIAEMQKTMVAKGIEWHCLAYHKRFSVIATLYDVLLGALFTRRFIKAKKPDILHCRVHIPMLMAVLARKWSSHKPKLLFDIRGFFPEEYVDAGRWKDGGLLYRSVKVIERWLMKESDGFVVLTEKARAILFPESKDTGSDKLGRPVEVIPCCVDLERFRSATPETRQQMRTKLGVNDRFVVVYVGSFGGWYLTNETADLLAVARSIDESTFAMILTQSDPEMIKPLLLQRGFTEQDIFIQKVSPQELPLYLGSADIAVSFIKKCYSKQSSSPTKNAEYLASGLPIIANEGVGDVDELINDHGVGALIDKFGVDEYVNAIDKAKKIHNIDATSRLVARSEFDLQNVAGVRYRDLYLKLIRKVKIQL